MAATIRTWRGGGAQGRADDIRRRLERALERRRTLDPRAQLGALALMNLTATTPTPAALDILCVLSAGAVCAWCGRWRAAGAWLAGYAVLWAAALLCAASADPLFSSAGGMLMMGRKMYAVAMLAVNLVSCARVGEVACALQRMHVPRLAIVALSVALRFFPTLAVETGAVLDAMKLRGICLSVRGVARHPLRTLEHIVVPLVLRASTTADEIARAATVRGIDSSRPRTSLYDLRMGAAGWFFLLWFAALTAASAALAGDGLTLMGLF